MKACGDLTFNGTSGEILLAHRVRFDPFLVQVHVGSLLPPWWQTARGFHSGLVGWGAVLFAEAENPVSLRLPHSCPL